MLHLQITHLDSDGLLYAVVTPNLFEYTSELLK